MIGAALDKYVAGPHQGFPLIQHRPDLALQNYRVVDRVGLMEQSMPRFSLIQSMTAANFFHHLARASLEDLVRRKVDYAENGASTWRFDPQRAALWRRILVTSIRRRRIVSDPKHRIDELRDRWRAEGIRCRTI